MNHHQRSYNPHHHHQHKISTKPAATTRRKRRQQFCQGVPFLLLVLFVALAVTLVTVVVIVPPLILTTSQSSSYSSSSSYLFDLLEDFSYETIKSRPWRNNNNNSTSSSSNCCYNNRTKKDDVIIFYHIYIPPRKGKAGQAKALQVVEEQLAQIAASRRNYIMTMTMTTTTENITANVTTAVTAAAPPSETIPQEVQQVVLWTVYYTTTGVKNVISASWMRHTCRVHLLKCIPTQPHLLVGDEDVTLNHLYDYCQQQPYQKDVVNDNDNNDNDDRRVVVYMHTKGTHHAAQGRNDIWRRHLTAAVTHPDCLNAVQQMTVAVSSLSSSSSPNDNTTNTTTTRHSYELLERRCDVCGLQFYPIWTTFFPGNFWTARCSYIQTLMPLPNYTLALHDAVVSALPTEQNSSLSSSSHFISSSSSSSWHAQLYRASNPGNVGLERFAAEHWVASHPHVQPCDLSESNRIKDYWTAAAAATTTTITDASSTISEETQQQRMQEHHHNWSIALAPRKSIHAPWFRLNHSALVDILQEPNKNMSRYEWFLLPGFLYRWKRIYGLYPKADSWIWDWYPNGNDWKQSIFSSSSSTEHVQQQNEAFPLWWLAAAPPE